MLPSRSVGRGVMQIADQDTGGGVLRSATDTLLIDFNARCYSNLFPYTRCGYRYNCNSAPLLVSFLFEVLGELLFIVEYLLEGGVTVPVLLFAVHPRLLEPVDLALHDLRLLVLPARRCRHGQPLLEGRADVAEGAVRDRRIAPHKVTYRYSPTALNSTCVTIVGSHGPGDLGRVRAEVALHPSDRSSLWFTSKILVENNFFVELTCLVIFFNRFN